MHENSLKNKTIKGVGWSAVDAYLGQGVTFIVGLVLTRLLSPDEYGLIGICGAPAKTCVFVCNLLL